METLTPPTQNTVAGQKNHTMNTTIETQPVPVVEHDTKQEGVIELTISEVDRTEADRYTDIENCLICTALKNRGYNVYSVGPNTAKLEGYSDEWKFDEYMAADVLHSVPFRLSKPFYEPCVVGKVIRLRKVS
jgi:hypothetical protein